jgi:hypothetical protein
MAHRFVAEFRLVQFLIRQASVAPRVKFPSDFIDELEASKSVPSAYFEVFSESAQVFGLGMR